MKHIKLFENFNKSDLDKELSKYYIYNYTINSDGTIDVNDDVYLSSKNLTKIPFRFGKVSGNFQIHINQIKSLEGCPEEVGGDFSCYANKLVSLYGSPKIVNGNYYCSGNKLKNLKYCPSEINGNFYCSNNNLENLEYMPLEISGDFRCFNNKFLELDSVSNIDGFIYCDDTVDTSKFEGFCKEIIRVDKKGNNIE